MPEGAERQASDYAAQGRGYWLRVEGDAMTAPMGLSVPQGMLILVDSGIAAEPGKLLIARSADSTATVFRQLIEEGGQRYLKPLNPTYPKALFTEQTQVLGVVVQALMKFL
ncbi:LexA repressor [compost metagenome]